jgi:cobalt transporter subunit CbtA
MIKHMLTSAVFAGFAVGVLVAGLQFAFVERDILLAEQYETGALTHFAGVAVGEHDHAAAEAAPAEATAEVHDHTQSDAEAETSSVQRHGLTVLFAILTYAGYALVLVAGYGLAGQFGRKIDVKTGLLWGLAGFAVFQMAPAMGLQPDMPGTPGADLTARQVWWFGTALATAGGLALLGYGAGVVSRVVGVVLLALPHAIGAPEMAVFAGVVPPELASAFAARTLGVGMIAWVTLGGLAAWFWMKEPA